MANEFNLGIIVNYNPGNAITGLGTLEKSLVDVKTAAAAFDQGFAGMGGGLDNFVAKGERAASFLNGLRSSIPTISNAMAGISTGANQAGTSLAELGSKTQTASSNMQNAVTSINNIRTTFSAANVTIVGMGNSMTTLGSRASTLAGQLTQFNGPLSNLFRLVSQANTPIANLGNTVTQTAARFSAGLAPAVAAVGGPLNNLNAQLGGAAGGLNNLGNAGNNASTGLGRLRDIFSGNRGLVFGFSALFGTITGIAFELQLMADASKQVADSQAVVNGLVAAGQQGTAQYDQAVQALGKDQRFLEFSTRNLALAFTNLIPDALLITSGLINLSAKFATTGTAATTMGTAFTATGTAMTGTQTAMNALTGEMTATSSTMGILNSAQTALTAETTVMRDLYAGVPPVMAAARAEETLLATSTDVLGASQVAMGTETAVARDVVGTVGPVMAATRAEEGLLAGENAILGDSFVAMAAKANTSVGGLKGIFSKIGGSIGGFLGGTGGAVLGPIALAGAFATAVEIIIQGAKETDQKILETGKILDSANRATSSSIDVLINKTRAGTATMSESWDAWSASVQRNAGIAADAMANVAPPSLLGEKNLAAGTAGQADNGPIANWLKALNIPNFSTPESQKPPVGLDLRKRDPKGNIIGAPTPPPPVDLKTVMADQEKQLAIETADVNKRMMFNAGRDIGKFPLTKALTPDQVSQAQAAVDAINATKSQALLHPGGKLTGQDQEKITKSYEDLQKALYGAGTASDILKQQEEDKAKVEQRGNDILNDYNKMLDTMPKILQDTGVYTKALSKEEQNRQDIIRDSAQVFIGHANAQAISLGVAEKVVEVAGKLTEGLIDQRDTLTATNLVWGNMGTIIGGTNQTLGEWINVQQQSIIGSIDVTQALTNQTKAQFLTTQGMIAGKLAAQQFLEQTITGVAQNKQYTDSLQGIISAMGIELPAGMKLTAQQAEAVIQSFEETGSAAAAFAAIINDRIEPAVQRLGDVLTAKSWKEFKDAFKGLEFGDTPDKLVSKFKDFDNMLRKINEDGREMQTVFDHMDIMQSLGKLNVKEFSSGLEAMAKQVEHIGKLQDIDVSKITGFLDALQKTKDPSMLVRYHDILVKIGEYSKNGYTSQEMADLNYELDKIDPSKLEELSKHLEEVSKNAKEILKNDWSKFGQFVQSGVITSPDAGYVTPKEPQKPEDKFSGAVDKFSAAVGTFASKATTPPVTTPAPPFPQGQGGPYNLKPGVSEWTTTSGQKWFQSAEKNAIVKKPDYPGPFWGTQPTDPMGDLYRNEPPMYGVRPELPHMERPPVGGTILTSVSGGTEVSAGARVGIGGGLRAGAQIQQPSATDAFKGGGPMGPMVAQTAEMSKQIQTLYSSMFTAIIGIVTGMVKAITTQFSTLGVTVVKLMGSMVTNVVKETATLGVSVVKVMSGMVVNVTKEVSAMDVAIIKDVGVMNVSVIKGVSAMVVSVIKTIGTMVTSTVTAFSQMAVGSLQQVTIFVTTVIKAGTDMMNGWLVSVAAMGVDTITAFEIMSKAVQTSVSNLYTFVTTVAKKMDDDVVAAIEDMRDKGGAAVKSFASTMDSELTKVAKAAGTAWQAVTDLSDAVEELNGASATVTVTTNFKTTGTPPKQTGDVTINRLMGAVISAASTKSFQYGGSIETSHGPQMAIFGDNPGGEETVAFIPHDNPFPTLRKLQKLFKGNSSSEIVDRALGQAESMWIDLHLQIDNIMDGEKISRQIVRKTFKKMRTRP